ncbi:MULTISPECIES: ABC transporter ATP-binding protein [Pseudothermotoga]|jgi:peptide/nickel transport system ATP-binding protein/oligopeptide transport system ATP-binding protein|uniref:Oligopeptide/dipeptide ABC transporter, ATPase subunit n=1 Tax=Pseudothermotoga lettingae (strain ATCC BAA-301 / DSM 14385 / NBRC 107922 / TMO) TaxID=416591 RepID=A8F6T3_PSELT|nr:MULTISPECIES: ABC transporter ATP-binding protein [Pseudothermotoga]ABV33867.1 oligopeptide/dipeptide ABC transporter, ATPase subunit [Pseudothermotoga lettingae TMO]KUK20966.1 MAG: Oligopeptide/dipeptide ABC transporter, ATPase subunit [Pseudothermotoga lettingae]MDK2884304.1 peptide/nickel transport system ATP-binding protein [Pseudothermotoga sp.]GLI49196.1 ABC transporter ATP-binding protein [Pseudothermotoga lettingae TMO]
MEKILELEGISKWFTIKKHFGKRSYLKAVDDVHFFVDRGETFGLVGESGCGKTTLGRLVVRLYQPTSGRVIYHENNNLVDLSSLDEKSFQKYRAKIQMIFQDPYSSLNPRLTVLQIVTEGLSSSSLSISDKKRLASQALENVGLRPEYLYRYPHEFSGGQRQRIGIARALIMQPELLICDEPVSALDVSVQAQVINLLTALKEKYKLTYIFIAHDLAVVKYISDRIAVMYLGKLVELSNSKDLFNHPLHPYTQALIASVPVADPKMRKLAKIQPIQGEITSPIDPPQACLFASRCPYAMKICHQGIPELKTVENSHQVACFLYH